MADDNKYKGKISLKRVQDLAKDNPVIKSRQTRIKHNPHTYATQGSPYKPKTNPLEEQIDRFQRSETGREMGYNDSELASIIKENPATAKELFVKMKDNDRYGMSELRSLGGASEYYEQEYESVVSHHKLGNTVNPLDIMAGRMAGKDVTGLHSFVGHLGTAQSLLTSNVGLNHLSKDPAELIAYGARAQGIDLAGLESRLRASEGFKFHDVKELKGVKGGTQALTVFRAMTGEDRAQQQVDKADLITPQMYKDASADKFIKDAVAITDAFSRITDYYINPLELQKDTGLKENNDLERTRRRVQNYLENNLPAQITNQSIHFAQDGKGAWGDALPHPDVVAAALGSSKFSDVYKPYLKTSTVMQDLPNTGADLSALLQPKDFKDDLKTIQRAFKSSNQGGLKHKFDPDMRSNVHELDEISRMGDDNFATYITGSEQAGYIDPVTGQRTEAFDPFIESEATRTLDNVYGALGIQRQGVDGESNQTSKAEKALVRETIARLGEEGQTVFESLNPWSEGTTQHNYVQNQRLPEAGYVSSAGGGRLSTSSVGHSSPLDPVNQGPSPWPTMGTTTSNKGERFWSGGSTSTEYVQGAPKDIEENRRRQEAFFNNNPELTFLSNDDDKHSAGSVWHQKRQGLLSSSAIPNLTNEKKSGAVIKGLYSDALKSEEDKVFKPNPNSNNLNFSAGDALEEQGIGWYKANVDASIFEPGMLKSNDPSKRGQSTTPDAMTSDGKKVVEFKSAQLLSNPYADPSTQEGRSQRQQWQTYYAQLQHQMYMTGAESGDIVQMMKDPLNPHLPSGGKFNSENIQRKSFARDDDYIKRMSPIWEQFGQNADKLAGLDPSIQKNLAKAVSEGNIDSYEKLSKKHGFDSDGSIRSALFGEGAGGTGSSRRGGGGSGGGGDSGVFSGIAGANRPGSQGIIRGALSKSPWGRAINIATGIAEALYDTTMDSNDFSVATAASSRGAGYGNEDMFRNARNSMQRNRFVSAQDAIRDITALSTASGGLQTGHTGEAVNIVTATRGAVSFEDIYNLNQEDEDAMANLVAKAESSMKANGYSDFAISAMMKKAGLSSGLSVDSESMEGRKAFNDAAVVMATSVETAKLELIKTAGNVGESIVTAVDRIYTHLSGDSPSATGNNFSSNKSPVKPASNSVNTVKPSATTTTPKPKVSFTFEPSPDDYVQRDSQWARDQAWWDKNNALLEASSLAHNATAVEDPTRFINDENASKLISAMNGNANLDKIMYEMTSTIENAGPDLIKAINGLAERLSETNNPEIAIRFKVEGDRVTVEAVGPDGKVMAKETAIY